MAVAEPVLKSPISIVSTDNMLTIYLKLTNYCNVNCDFCYLPDSVRNDNQSMSEDTLKRVIQLIESMARQGHKQIFILYHGGEPLTLSTEYLYKCSDMIHKGLSDYEIIEGIQTSLVPLKRAHIPFIKDRCDSVIGSSIDFAGRKINGSVQKYHDLWLKKVKLARDNHINVCPTIVPSVRELGKEAEILGWLVENDFDYFNIDRYSSLEGDDINMPTNKQHSQFLTNLYEETKRFISKGDVIGNNVFDSAFNGIDRGLPGDRWGGTCQSNFVVINPNGDINSCPDRIEHEVPFGNANNVEPIKIINSPGRQKWIKEQTFGHRNSDCATCDHNHWCKSGCPIAVNKDKSNECSGYISFLNHIKNDPGQNIYRSSMLDPTAQFNQYRVGGI